jgi:hypothetical protein
MTDSTLSSADSALLERLFNPTGSPIHTSTIHTHTTLTKHKISGIDFGTAPQSVSTSDAVLYKELDASTLKQIRSDETKAVILAEQNELEQSLAGVFLQYSFLFDLSRV